MRKEPFDIMPVLICNGVLLKVSDKLDGKWVSRAATEQEQDEYDKESEYNK